MKTVVLDIIFTGFSSRADHGMGFRGVTPELTPVEKTALMELHGINIRALLEPRDFTPTTKVEVRGQFDSKTPSQRLRSVLFLMWRECAGGAGDFEQFYRARLEEFIESVKAKLPENG